MALIFIVWHLFSTLSNYPCVIDVRAGVCTVSVMPSK